MHTQIAKRFWSFNDARNFVRNLKLKTFKDYRKYSGFDCFHPCLPKAPNSFYKEWISWYDFLGTNSDRRKYYVNDDYFKTWSSNMAYILGLWFTDGCICEKHGKKGSFSIRLDKQDRYLLKNIAKEMQSNYPLYQSKNSNTINFAISSTEIYRDIVRLGGKERKSLDVKFPKIPKKYLPDFIRGLWDGDGCVSFGRVTKSGNKIGCSAQMVSGSKGFIKSLYRILKNNIVGIQINYYIRIRPAGTKFIDGRIRKNDSTIYRLCLSANSARKLRDFMYTKNCDLKMIRKHKKFIDAGESKPFYGNRVYVNFNKAKKIVANKNFCNIQDYTRWVQGKDCNVILPRCPYLVYKKQWKGDGDFLGHYRLSYNELSKQVIKNGIKSSAQYRAWIHKVRNNTRGRYPSHPEDVYPEWRGWDKFLNKSSVKSVESV